MKTLARRTFLKGLGTTMAIPLMEAMMSDAALAAGSSTAPVRSCFIFFPNGAIMPSWTPTGTGKNFQLNTTMKPLEDLKGDLNIFSGLAQHHGRANGDGAGDHARNSGSFLTGAQPRKTSGANIHVGVSADQVAAQHAGKETKLPSLELGIYRGRNAGSCDSGYSCAYSSNISWKTPTTPMAKEINPKLAFERLFGSGSEQEKQKGKARRDLYRKSILDLVADDAAQLRKQLGQTDKQKLDEYFSSVRELEQQIERSATKQSEVPDYNVPAGIPKDHGDHIRLMYDIQALAFQTDTTRISSFMLHNAGSNQSYPQVGVRSGHHQLSHHRRDKNKMADIQKIDEYLVGHLAYFLKKLKSIKEGNSTLLDNCMVLYGSAISDADRHAHHDLPIILAGRGGGAIETGRHLQYEKDTPLNNLFLSMVHTMGARSVEGIGDSKGPLKI